VGDRGCWGHSQNATLFVKQPDRNETTTHPDRNRLGRVSCADGFSCRSALRIDILLSSITAKQLRFIEAVLSNDENSTDEELRARFSAAGLAEAQVTRALQYRYLYVGRFYINDQTPIVMAAGGPENSVSPRLGVTS
jgi:hypothetical protein